MLKTAKITTAKMTVWVANGKVMLAKSASTGRFIARAIAQAIVDSLAYLAAKCHAVNATFAQSLEASQDFDKLVSDHSVSAILSNVLGSTQVSVLNARWALTSN